MSRKLLAGATALLLMSAMLSGSVGATAPKSARGDVALQRITPTAVPFARMNAAGLAKPAHVKPAQVTRTGSALKGKLEAELADKLAAPEAQAQQFDVLVATQAGPDALRNLVQGMNVTRTFGTAFKGFAAKLTAQQIRTLRGLAQVESISLDRPVTTSLDSAEKWTGVTKAREDFGLTGDRDGFPQQYSSEDVVIAVIDTGIDAGHKDLAGKVIGWADMVNGEAEPYDDHGHGTHVAGIAAGAGAANRSMRGVAPGAALVGVKVLDAEGSGTISGVIAGIEWVMDNKDEYNIKVLNMSLGASAPSDGTDPLSQAVNSAVESGIVAVVAAGNSGSDAGTVSTPAAADRAITVCAMRDVGEMGWSLAPWSSRGPTVDGRIKPDICAPGYKITAPMANTQSRYVAYSGTSMASPFVAGVAALLLQANPYLTVEEVQDALYKTAQDWGAEGKDSDFGYGRIDAYKAIRRVLGVGRGSAPANPTHAVATSSITAGVEDWWVVNVADTTKPLAATMLMTDSMFSDYDLDLYVYDEAGSLVASSADIGRQETANFRPLRPGAYYLLVTGYRGEGPYSLDLSWGTP